MARLLASIGKEANVYDCMLCGVFGMSRETIEYISPAERFPDRNPRLMVSVWKGLGGKPVARAKSCSIVTVSISAATSDLIEVYGEIEVKLSV